MPERTSRTDGPIINIRGEKVGLGPMDPAMLPELTRWINDFSTLRTLGIDPRPMTPGEEEQWYNRRQPTPAPSSSRSTTSRTWRTSAARTPTPSAATPDLRGRYRHPRSRAARQGTRHRGGAAHHRLRLSRAGNAQCPPQRAAFNQAGSAPTRGRGSGSTTSPGGDPAQPSALGPVSMDVLASEGEPGDVADDGTGRAAVSAPDPPIINIHGEKVALGPSIARSSRSRPRGSTSGRPRARSAAMPGP